MFELFALALLQIATLTGSPVAQPNGQNANTELDGGSGGWGHDINGANADGGSGGWGHDIDGGSGGWGHDING